MSAVLQRKVLVLNRTWTAVGVCTLKRAITQLFKGVATIIDPTRQFETFTWDEWSKVRPKEGEDYIATANVIFRIPEVIHLHGYNELPMQKLKFSRRQLYKRDNNQCQYCGARPGLAELNIDHVIPKSRGGLTTWENVCISCTECNHRKAARTMAEAKMKFFHPDYKPCKPRVALFKGDIHIKSWDSFVSEAFWNTTLQD